MPTLLVVSHGSVNLPHRRPYEVLASRRGWSVHIVAPRAIRIGSGQKRCDPPPPGARYCLHELEVRGQSSGRTTWFSGLRDVFARVRPDVVFLEYDPASLVVLEAWAVATRPRAPLVCFTVENIERHRWRDAWGGLLDGNLRSAVRDAGIGLLEVGGGAAVSGLACINREGLRIFREVKGWDKPLDVMPLGTDTELFRPMDSEATRRTLGVSGKFVVGYFGRLIPEKGVHLLVEALAGLPDSVCLLLDMFANFEPGSYAGELMSTADKLGVRNRIVTIDVPHGEVPIYMNACDVVVLPSLSSDRWKEQFGRVVPEAMACGVPVIGSDSGNIPDAIGDAGVVVAEGSARAIVDAVLRLVESPELRSALSERGRRRVRERMSVDAQVDVLERLLLRARQAARSEPLRRPDRDGEPC